MKKLILGCAVFASCAAVAVNIDSVLVRQDWPWSSSLKVEYRVSDTAGNPFDITVSISNGGTAVAAEVVRSALTDGELYAVDGSEALHTLTFDPKTLFGSTVKGLSDVRVSITAAPTVNATEVLYRIFDLEAKTVTDVTRADLLNNKYGAIETDYSKIGAGFTTTLDDVLIWTDAVNYPGAKTTKLIMRRVNAANKTFTFGSTAAEYGHQSNETNVTVKLTEDFFIGIFEFTQKQFALLGYGDKDPWGIDWITPSYVGDALPFNQQRNRIVRGAHDIVDWEGKKINWPNNAEYPHTWWHQSVCGKLRAKFSHAFEFDLPTEAQWEFACRGGSTTSMPSGKDPGTDSLKDSRINEYAQECGWIYGYGFKAADMYPHEVGLKAPNAYGLYDMIGNVSEQCLDYMSKSTVSWASDGVVTDPTGPAKDLDDLDGYGTNHRVFRGPNYGTWYAYSRIAFRLHINDSYNGMGEGQCSTYIGFRLVIPATANGKWASSPEKTH